MDEEGLSMRRFSLLCSLLIVHCLLLTAQNEWVLQPWMQVVGYSGQNLGSSVGFIGKVGDSTQISVSDVHGIQMYRIKSPSDTVPRFVFPGGKSLLGDFNGDGIKDLVVGGNPTKIYLGKAVGVFDTTAFFTKYKDANGDDFGSHLAIGKINGDKYDDLVISDVGPNIYKGKVYVFFGGVAMDTIPAYVFNGDSKLSFFGWSVATGDLNNDGFDDIVVKGLDQSGTGPHGTIIFAYIKIFLGGNQIDTIAWKHIKGGSNAGIGVASFDVNGDGIKDLLWTSANDTITCVNVHFSRAGDIDTLPSLVLLNPWASNITNAGDMNGDGYNDIVISDNYSDNGGNSFIFVYSGGPKMDTHFDAAVGLGGDSNLGSFGSLATIGDINNDGCADLLIGAPSYQWGTNQGYFGIFLGSKNIPVTAVTEITNVQPVNFELLQNYPNPFNSSTTITYALKSEANVMLTIYNTLSQKLTDLVHEQQTSGEHRVAFDASAYSSGIYFYKLTAVNKQGQVQTETKGMTLMK
jgi:hypothetical protein